MQPNLLGLSFVVFFVCSASSVPITCDSTFYESEKLIAASQLNICLDTADTGDDAENAVCDCIEPYACFFKDALDAAKGEVSQSAKNDPRFASLSHFKPCIIHDVESDISELLNSISGSKCVACQIPNGIDDPLASDPETTRLEHQNKDATHETVSYSELLQRTPPDCDDLEYFSNVISDATDQMTACSSGNKKTKCSCMADTACIYTYWRDSCKAASTVSDAANSLHMNAMYELGEQCNGIGDGEYVPDKDYCEEGNIAVRLPRQSAYPAEEHQPYDAWTRPENQKVLLRLADPDDGVAQMRYRIKMGSFKKKSERSGYVSAMDEVVDAHHLFVEEGGGTEGYYKDPEHTGFKGAIVVEPGYDKAQDRDDDIPNSDKHHPDKHHPDKHHPDKHHPDKHHPDKHLP